MLDDTIRAFLQKQLIARMSTIGADGYPHTVPVWFMLDGDDIPEPMLNRIEHGIRCYDPCLSCSTHAVGQMPLRVQLIGSGGRVLKEVTRG